MITKQDLPAAVVFRGFISISEGWILLCKKLIIAEDSRHINEQWLTMLRYSLGVLVGVSVLEHSPSLGILAGVNVF